MKKTILFVIIGVLLSGLVVSASTSVLLKTYSTDSKETTVERLKESMFIVHFNIGNYYFNQGYLEKAEKSFKSSIGLNPEFELAYHNLGTIYYNQGKISEALDSFNKAAEINEDYAKAHYSLGILYRELQDYDNAIIHLKKAALLEQDPNAFFDLGVTYSDRFRFAQGDIEDLNSAIIAYQNTIEIDPDFPHALNNLEIIENILI